MLKNWLFCLSVRNFIKLGFFIDYFTKFFANKVVSFYFGFVIVFLEKFFVEFLFKRFYQCIPSFTNLKFFSFIFCIINTILCTLLIII